MRKFKKSWLTPKTNQQEVFDYIVKYEKMNKEIPTGRLIGRVFGISAERGNQYRKMFINKLNLKK